MNLNDLISLVKEEGLTKSALESYHTQLTNLYALYSLEMADLEKAEAIYISGLKEGTNVARKASWAVTEAGQKQIDVKHSLRALDKLLSSVKNRIYSRYD